MDEQRPRVGLGVMIFKDEKILLGKRKGSHGEGEYACPGGHLDYMESFETCAKREVAEECGITIKNVAFQYLANLQQYASKHYVHIGLIAEWDGGVPKVLEPEKCEDWKWYSLESLPQPMFYSCELSIEAYRTKQVYFDVEKE